MAKSATVMIAGRRYEGPVDIGRPVLRTRYANRLSYDNRNAPEPTLGKIIHIPGKLQDLPYENTAFPWEGGRIATETPIAAFAAVVEKGELVLKSTFYDHWGSSLASVKEWVDKHTPTYGYAGALKRVATANIVSKSVIDSTKSLNILDRVLGLRTRSFLLKNVVTPLPAPNLVFTVDTYSEGSVQAKVPELQEPLLIAHSESRTTKILYKNVGHIAISEEAELLQSHNTMALRQDKTLRDMVRLENAQVATELETGGATGGSDWGAKTTGTSDNDPHDDVGPRLTAISDAGFDPNFMAMHQRPAMDFDGNTYINGGQFKGPSPTFSAREFAVPGFPPITVDNALTNTKATIGDRSAMWLAEGPTIVATYDSVISGYRGWLVKKWLLPYLAESGGVNVLTGISA